MYCPECRGEYRDGFTRCATCKKDLVAELPPEDDFASPETMARKLAGQEVQALMVGSHVDLGEVQKFLASKRVASVLAGEAKDEIEVPILHHRLFLMVATDELERARDLIHQRWRDGAIAQGLLLADTPPPGDGKCPACNAAVPPNASECPDCGLFLGDAESVESAAESKP